MDKINMSYMPISGINPAAYNPRKITDEELAGLKESIKKFGFVDPVIVNKRTNTLVGGHQRVKAAEQLGMNEVPVVFVDLSLSEEKALNVVLNSHTTAGKYDLEVLPTLLEEIKLELPELALELRFDQLEKDLGLNFNPEFEEDQDGEGVSDKLALEVLFSDKDELEEVYKELLGKGLIVKIK